MARGSSSEISRRSPPPAIALASLSVAGGALLITSPVIAIGVAPLVYGLTDLAAAHAIGWVGPTARVRVVARSLASAAWGGAISTIVATRGSEGRIRLPLLAIALALGTLIGVYGSGGRRALGNEPARPPTAESPLIGACDVVTAGWALVNAISAHGRDLRTRLVVMIAVAVAVALRALVVARISARSSARSSKRDPESAGLAAIGFVAWLALASIACTLAATPLTWSGLGAAWVLTLAGALAESQKKRAVVVLLRGSLAFALATMLGIAVFVGT